MFDFPNDNDYHLDFNNYIFEKVFSMGKKIISFLTLMFVLNTSLAADALVIFSGRSDKFVKPVLEAFTRETGIDVVLHASKSTALLNKLQLEGERTSADIFLSNDAGTLQKGSELGLFATIPPEFTNTVPINYRAKDNTWIGLSARARVLVVNTEVDRSKSIQSVFDLADSKLKGQIAITNSTNESYIAGVTVYMLATTKDKVKSWLEGLKHNAEGKVFNKHSKIVSDVASGKHAVGLVNHYYIYRHLAKHPKAPISILIPDQDKNGMGVAWNVAGVAISKHSKKQQQAQKLIEFLISPKGQKQFAEVNREYPTRKGVPASDEVPPLDEFRVADVPMYQLGTKRNETIDLIEAVGMP
jgi:iron(III) transport system substrate-binding protein